MQDLSYLQRDRYDLLMRNWLSAAERMDAGTIKQLATFCAASQPHHADMSDLVITYKDNDHFSALALQLGPMMWDISYGVS